MKPFPIHWPRTLFMRLALAWCSILMLTHILEIVISYSGLRHQLAHHGVTIFVFQLLAALGMSWLAARQATQPLRQLADSAESLGASMECAPIAEEGPIEVARAAAAFNAMGGRIRSHLDERVRMLAAISHDLQTPITRLRLRAELMDDPQARRKWLADLDAMESLVRDGLAYARSKDRVQEVPCAVDIGALADELAGAYADAGQALATQEWGRHVVVTRPQALRRLLVNLLDNAFKFAGAAELRVEPLADGGVRLGVLDRGPGIPPSELAAVFEPFYRVESSRSRDTGGTGLGLSIARELANALRGTLELHNRDGGGLEASLSLPPA